MDNNYITKNAQTDHETIKYLDLWSILIYATLSKFTNKLAHKNETYKKILLYKEYKKNVKHIRCICMMSFNGGEKNIVVDNLLCWASMFGHLDIIKCSLCYWSKFYMTLFSFSNKQCAMSLACLYGHFEIIKYFVKLKFDVSIAAFRWACLNGNTQIITYLASINPALIKNNYTNMLMYTNEENELE